MRNSAGSCGWRSSGTRIMLELPRRPCRMGAASRWWMRARGSKTASRPRKGRSSRMPKSPRWPPTRCESTSWIRRAEFLRTAAGRAGVARQVGGPPALLAGGVEDFGPILVELLGFGGGALFEVPQDMGALRRHGVQRVGEQPAGGGAVVHFSQRLLNAAQGGQARVQTGTVARTEDLQRVAQALGEKPDPVQFGRGRFAGEQRADPREIAGGELGKLAAGIGGGAHPLIPADLVQLAHALSSRRLRHFREKSRPFQRRISSSNSWLALRRSAAIRVAMAARGGMPASTRSWRAISRSRTLPAASIRSAS